MRKGLAYVAVLWIVSAVVVFTAGGFMVKVVNDKFFQSAQKSGDKTFVEDKIIEKARQICKDPGLDKLPPDSDGYKHRFSGLKKAEICGEGTAICLNYKDAQLSEQFRGLCDSYEIENTETGGNTFSSEGSGVSGDWKISLEQDGGTLVVKASPGG